MSWRERYGSVAPEGLPDLGSFLDHRSVRAYADRSVSETTIQGLVAAYVAARSFTSGHVDRVLAGTDGVGEGSMAKVLYTEAYNEIARFGVTLVATYGPATEPVADAALRLQDAWLWSRVLTISGGSSEVNRNILAKRRLHLPSAP